MPNICCYEMKIIGKKENVNKLITYLQAFYDYNSSAEVCKEDKHFFRVFDAYVDEQTDQYAIVSGSCAWSVTSCMLHQGNINYYTDFKKRYPKIFQGTCMEETTEELDLKVEIFSEEPGEGFMEHYLIDKGKILIDDCVDYYEEYDEETDEIHPIGGLKWEYVS